MPRDNVPSNTQGDSTSQPGLKADGILQFLKAEGIPVNRANYLAWGFMDPKITPDTDLGAELEMALPPSVRHPNYKARPK